MTLSFSICGVGDRGPGAAADAGWLRPGWSLLGMLAPCPGLAAVGACGRGGEDRPPAAVLHRPVRLTISQGLLLDNFLALLYP